MATQLDSSRSSLYHNTAPACLKAPPQIPTAIYCRVSTTHPHQQDSLENQITHYQDFMKNNPEYSLTKIYYDFGISGYKEERPGFSQMLQDAENGHFRQIITKSITRFARNTDIILKTTRQLRSLEIDVYFELQKIHTLSQEGELLLTLYAAFGQAESENARWLTQVSRQRKYEKAQPIQQLHRCLGYGKSPQGELQPDENARLVQKIFRMAAEGWRIVEITRYLNQNQITTQNGKCFTRSAVSRILHNHAYKGDYICQRYYVNNQRKLVRNKGEKQMYYIRHDHVALVSEELWEKAQQSLRLHAGSAFGKNLTEKPTSEQFPIGINPTSANPTPPPPVPPLTLSNYPYKDRIFCKYCGSRLRRIIARNRSVWWICNGLSRKGKSFCKGVRVPDEKLFPLQTHTTHAYIGKEIINGKETYGYSTQPDRRKC